MVRNREEAAKLAESSYNNKPGTCQLWTRTIFDAPSVGDVDRDGDADAVDGWQSEPESARHTDRKPPRGTPVAWGGGSKGYGHRAISLGPDKNDVYQIRSTDAGGSGKIATVPLSFFEERWGMKYLGWSETISGFEIPGAPVIPPKPPVVKDRGWRVEKALKLLEFAHRKSKTGKRKRQLAAAIAAVKAISPVA